MCKILIPGEGITPLKLYVAVLTQFAPPSGQLACRVATILAEDALSASVLAAAKYPGWELQVLECLTELPWFQCITLDPNCPQLAAIRDWVITNIKPVVDAPRAG